MTHVVQFYENEDALYSLVSGFIAEGLSAGDPVIVVATEEHRRSLAARIDAKTLDFDPARLLMLDAHQLLASFMVESMPDAKRFDETAGRVIRRHMTNDGTRLRVFGEMVDILWREANTDATLRLEDLWNELEEQIGFQLLCAYSLDAAVNGNNGTAFESICRRHEHVIPTLRDALAAKHRSRKRLEDANAFLLDATTALNRSLDFETRLQEISRVAVPRFADSCVVELEGVAKPSATEHSIVAVMTSGDRTLGTITLTSAGRAPYDQTDVAIANELANRAAIALENARLYQLAQVANRTKDEFLATLSHELRTPLTAILGWSRMMLLGGFDAETTRTALETIERSARSQAALIDDLLDLSKIVTGKLTLQTEMVDMSSVIYNAVQTTKLAADAKSISLDVAGITERAVVIGDATRLQQIVWNLLSNAIKFSAPGGRVSLLLERTRGEARIVVRDNGSGIHPDFLPHVFEPFRQADGASTRAHNGLGLGLAIVRYLAEHHGGSVAAESEGPGSGATFTVTLPLAATRSRHVNRAAKSDAVDLSGTSILLVDDDPDTRDVVSAILRRCGAEVDSASCVNEACERLDAKLPHVLVTDIAMPDRDGFALLKYLRGRNDSAHDVRLVALTATSSQSAEEDLRDAGFHAYVRKPIDPLDFARVIAGL